MKKQLTLAVNDFERYRKPTRREKFLAEMDQVVPWKALCAVIEEQGGQKSYWAARHAGEKPDFHNPACFILPVP